MGVLTWVLSLTSPNCRPLNKYVILNLNLSSQRLKKLNVNHRRRLFLFEKSFVFKFSLISCVCKNSTTHAKLFTNCILNCRQEHVYRRRQRKSHFGKIFLEPHEQFTNSHDLSRLSQTWPQGREVMRPRRVA